MRILIVGNGGREHTLAWKLRRDAPDATLFVTHPPPPIGGRLSADRNHQLRQLMMFRRESAGPVCIAGDLNVTPWSPAFARMRQGAGLVDSLRGRGVQPTWPTWFPLAGIPIDHFLHTPEVTVTRRETGPRIGSDHLPILVDFTWQLSE